MRNSIGLFYQITVKDKNGKIIKKTRMRKSKSFVIAFLQLLECQGMGVQPTIKDTSAANITAIKNATNLDLAALESDVTRGILVGTGTTTPTNADYVMETLIVDGNGAGEMEYAAQAYVSAQEVGANVDLQFSRTIQNLSGNTINITEAGICNVFNTNKKAMTVHDVFTAVPVADGQTITVTYTLRTTV